jgi:hypothetical protein
MTVPCFLTESLPAAPFPLALFPAALLSVAPFPAALLSADPLRAGPIPLPATLLSQEFPLLPETLL